MLNLGSKWCGCSMPSIGRSTCRKKFQRRLNRGLGVPQDRSGQVKRKEKFSPKGVRTPNRPNLTSHCTECAVPPSFKWHRAYYSRHSQQFLCLKIQFLICLITEIILFAINLPCLTNSSLPYWSKLTFRHRASSI